MLRFCSALVRHLPVCMPPRERLLASSARERVEREGLLQLVHTVEAFDPRLRPFEPRLRHFNPKSRYPIHDRDIRFQDSKIGRFYPTLRHQSRMETFSQGLKHSISDRDNRSKFGTFSPKMRHSTQDRDIQSNVETVSPRLRQSIRDRDNPSHSCRTYTLRAKKPRRAVFWKQFVRKPLQVQPLQFTRKHNSCTTYGGP